MKKTLQKNYYSYLSKIDLNLKETCFEKLFEYGYIDSWFEISLSKKILLIVYWQYN